MPSISIRAHGKNDVSERRTKEVIFHDVNADWKMAVIEGGMASGQPSVMLQVVTEEGLIMLETSLNALITATHGLRVLAETRFGWTQPP